MPDSINYKDGCQENTEERNGIKKIKSADQPEPIREDAQTCSEPAEVAVPHHDGDDEESSRGTDPTEETRHGNGCKSPGFCCQNRGALRLIGLGSKTLCEPDQ